MTVTVDSAELYCTVHGRGPACLVLSAIGTPPHGDMGALGAQSAAFFEAEADETRKRRLQENLAALPPESSPGQVLLAQTPMRFHDPTVDAAPLFDGAVYRPELLSHILGTLAPNWTITDDPGSLTVPVLLTHGRSDYVVPHALWDGIPETLPDATFHLFEASGHQPFFEEPARFTAVVTKWRQRAAPTSGEANG